MKIECAEHLECWQIARELVRMIYQLTNNGRFERDYALRDHIRKSAISVVSNIAEGFETTSNLEFSRFLNYSIRSLTELQSQLYISLDVGYLERDRFEELYKLASKNRQVCKGLARYLRRTQRTHKTPETP